MSKNAKIKVACHVSSSEEESISPFSDLKWSKKSQNKVDKQISDLEKTPATTGNASMKSKRGGFDDVTVKHKVTWPHVLILGGPSWQRITYVQISLTRVCSGGPHKYFRRERCGNQGMYGRISQ